MTITEIQSKSLLRKNKNIDSWFISRYGFNIFRGCSHACKYCDGRSEKYNAPDDFENDVAIKINAPELLKKELDPARKRKPLKRSFIMVGGGVGDAYQEAEHDYEITRELLRIIHDYSFPVHILTKSPLVYRDIEIIKEIYNKSGALISFSFSGTNEKFAEIFEPGTPTPSQRLKTIEKFSSAGIPCGAFLMPVLPFITDTPAEINRTLNDLKNAGAKYVVFSGLTLKQGRQKDLFFDIIKQNHGELLNQYEMIYPAGNKYGNAVNPYYASIHETFLSVNKLYKIPLRIPVKYFNNVLEINDLVCVILNHVDYLLKLTAKKSPYSYAAYSISKLDIPVTEMKDSEIRALSGIGKVTFKFIKEIIKTKYLKYLDYLTEQILQ